MPANGFPIKKSPVMHLFVLAGWAACVVGFVPSIFGLFYRSGLLHSPHSATLVGLLLVFLCIFWLYGSFFFFQFLMAFLERQKGHVQAPSTLARWPRVAILYTTFHDFQEKAVESCIQQQYPGGFRVFILDDSTRQEYKDRIDRFAARVGDVVQVVRRPAHNRTGYKAGNINYALRNEVTEYPYFAVFDADSIVPETFLAKIMPYFELDPTIAFLQGSHRPLPDQQTAFARDLCQWTDSVWNFMWRPKNRYGFVFFLGHGGVISYPKWRELPGGFPELVSEDLAISAQFHALGYRGWHVHDVYSYEEFPDDYRAFRKQQAKYVQGACEFMHQQYWGYFRSSNPRWYEKLDLFLTCTSLFLPVLMTVFCILFCIVMPWRFGLWHPVALHIGSLNLGEFPLLEQRFFWELWTWPFLLTMIACSFGPALGALSMVPSQSGAELRRGLKLVFLSAVPFMSIFVMGCVAVASYIVSRRAVFGVTADKTVKADEWVVEGLEQLFVILCGSACIQTGNFALLAPCLATLLGLMLRWDASDSLWESRMRFLLYTPMLCVFAGMAILAALAQVATQEQVRGLWNYP